MSKAKRDKKQIRIKTEVHEKLKHQLIDVSFIFTVFASLFLLLSLITFHWHNGPRYLRDAGGWVGHVIADNLLSFLGVTAYLLPCILLYSAWLFLKHKVKLAPITLVIKVVGAVLTLLGIATLSGLIGEEIQTLSYPSGGIIGQTCALILANAFSPIGASLVASAFCAMGLTLVLEVNWLLFFEFIGIFTLKAIGFIKRVILLPLQGLNAVSDKIKQYWQLKKAVRSEKLAQQETKIKVTHKRPVQPKQEKKSKNLETSPSDIVIKSKPSLSISKRYQTEQQGKLFSAYDTEIPSLNLLDKPQKSKSVAYSHDQLESMSREVEQRLLDFGIEVQVVAVHPGPVITRFELQLAPGLKVSKITGLGKDLARSLSMTSIRVVEVIPGKSVIGLELPNQEREMVSLSEVLATEQYEKASSALSLALGVDISGLPVIVNLAKMPHLLVAGTTGSGKSVGINAMLLSLLFKATPEEVRLILVDPKMLELAVYDGIPHLLTPVVTDMKDAANALRWSVAEMERRYKLMAAMGVRNLAGFNKKIKEAIENGEPILDPLWKPELPGEEDSARPELNTLPYIVIVIDELADMMMVVGKKVEQLIARIAQKARAAGIHLILATQRPSVDVLTGLIKSNIPTRISFQVSSKIDSRTILDQQGAEQLLGHGDMLYMPPGMGSPMRVHGAFVDDKEVHRVVKEWRGRGKPDYIEEIVDDSDDMADGFSLSGEETEEVDPLYDEAVAFITKARKASISSVQRRFKIGYNRAARLVEEMERTGVVSPMESNGSREVLAPPPVES